MNDPAPTTRTRWQQAALDQLLLGVHLVRWVVLGVLCGGLAGVSSFVFLEGLDRITRARTSHDWLLYLLPVAGLLVGLVYHLAGGRAAQGSSLLIEQIHTPTEWVPRRMAPLVLVGTWVTHLFGGSAGREGTALQMSASLTDAGSRLLRLNDEDRRILLIASLGGGFGAVFGVPLAGAVFALEVQSIGRVRYEALVPASTTIVSSPRARSRATHASTWSFKSRLVGAGALSAGRAAGSGQRYGSSEAAIPSQGLGTARPGSNTW